MLVFKNAMDVFKLLEKSNCRKCKRKNLPCLCLQSVSGPKTLDLCPSLSREVLDQYQEKQNGSDRVAVYRDRMLADLKNQIEACDLKAAAKRVGGVFSDSKLTIRIFGKPFSISSNGTMCSDIHINSFIAGPVLEYVLQCKGVPLTKKWIPFGSLKAAWK